MNLVLYACQSQKGEPDTREQLNKMREYCTEHEHSIADEITGNGAGGFAQALFATDNADGLLVFNAIGSVLTVKGHSDTRASFSRFMNGKAFFSLQGDETLDGLKTRWHSANDAMIAEALKKAD